MSITVSAERSHSPQSSTAGEPTIMIVYGTRPEAIKMAPLILALRADGRIRVRVTVTGQHRQMLDQVNASFGIVPDADLNIFQPGQSLTDVTVSTLTALTQLLVEDPPDAVMVHGDTSTTFVAALAAFYAKVPVVHTEAGLRTDNVMSPYPEEMNRRLTTVLSDLHLAPTDASRRNLLAAGVPAANIVVTGNSVIDALLLTVARESSLEDSPLGARLRHDRPAVLITAHRRESWGEPLRQVGRALATLAQRYPDHDFVYPAHRNPAVRAAILPAVAQYNNVVVTDPIAYPQFCALMARCDIVLTDSGGIQEEAPSLGKPVLVMRETTERPEAIEAGTARLIGTDEDGIVRAVAELIDDELAYQRMARAINPYGDGRAGERTVAALAEYFGLVTGALAEFTAVSSHA